MLNKKSRFNQFVLCLIYVCIGIFIGYFLSKYRGYTARHWFYQQEARKQEYGTLLGKQRIQEAQIRLFKECVSISDENANTQNSPTSAKQFETCLSILNTE